MCIYPHHHPIPPLTSPFPSRSSICSSLVVAVNASLSTVQRQVPLEPRSLSRSLICALVAPMATSTSPPRVSLILLVLAGIVKGSVGNGFLIVMCPLLQLFNRPLLQCQLKCQEKREDRERERDRLNWTRGMLKGRIPRRRRTKTKTIRKICQEARKTNLSYVRLVIMNIPNLTHYGTDR
jgi:hypothetical protein